MSNARPKKKRGVTEAMKPPVSVLRFGDGRYGISTHGNALLIYSIKKTEIGEKPDDKGTLVLAWVFDDPRATLVLIEALAALGIGHRQSEITLAPAEEVPRGK